MNQKTIISTFLLSFGLMFGTAQVSHAQAESSNKFPQIEQPLSLKLLVTLGGLGLIGAEVWWFVFSKTKSQQAQTHQGVQELDIIVDGGYAPDRIVVNLGQPVRLNFFRQDPSSCLEQVLFPDFHQAADLVLNQTTTVEFTPQKSGSYTFHCGMNMFRGVVEVQNTEDRADRDISQVNHNSHIPAVRELAEPEALSAQLHQGIQEMDIKVERGYEPARIIVQAGLPVRLNFFRQDPNNCLGKVLLPDFNIKADLPLNQAISLEFTPHQPGEYRFTCGMEMFHGIVEVRESGTASQQNRGEKVITHDRN
ncbi:cupredoxin domain-containing protein [Myxosarcina sp. GI1]|uniref:cupredoxin domain-containing protein n=1 Tax=Myxosarcina sp. GI1 TaxID=1541065 RepID=UPI000AAD4811|nr:cupredoxin domain-containing protein [Myxosarcina sp. GI1]